MKMGAQVTHTSSISLRVCVCVGENKGFVQERYDDVRGGARAYGSHYKL